MLYEVITLARDEDFRKQGRLAHTPRETYGVANHETGPIAPRGDDYRTRDPEAAVDEAQGGVRRGVSHETRPGETLELCLHDRVRRIRVDSYNFV